MPLLARLAFKPTPSISKEAGFGRIWKHIENETLVVKGRHDPCVAVRAVPITEAALALGILDCIMEVTIMTDIRFRSDETGHRQYRCTD